MCTQTSKRPHDIGLIDIYSTVGAVLVCSKYAEGTPEVRSRCGRGTLEVRSRYAQGTLEVRSGVTSLGKSYSRD